MKKTLLRNAAASVLLAAGFATTASAGNGTLTFQGVTFNTSYTGNTLTLEIDAANPTGDWATATTIGALELKSLGTFDSVTMTAAPGAAIGWAYSANELNANGCTGGDHTGQSFCYSGTHVALTDDMIFTWTFTGGTQDFTAPTLKVAFYNGDGTQKVGSLLSMTINPVPEPGTYAMMLGGLGLLAATARRRKDKGTGSRK